MPRSSYIPFEKEIHWEDLEKIFSFGANDFLRKCQLQGVAGLYNMLCRPNYNYAYLADDVGMGKTAQALALASLIVIQKPDAKILVVAPRENLQANWNKEFRNFIRKFYLQGDTSLVDTSVKDSYLNRPAFEPLYHDNLRTYALDVQFSTTPLHLLRLTSFARPVFLCTDDDPDTKREKYLKVIRESGLFRFKTEPGKSKGDTCPYNLAFGKSLGNLLRKQDKAYFDLVIIDEAQYLRNINQRNMVLQRMLQNNVKHWLFLSATPMHRDHEDVKTLVNGYVCPTTDNWPDDESEEGIAKHIRKFMIRRTRKVSIQGKEGLEKADYRNLSTVEEDAIPAEDKAIPPLAALSMAIVQKKLAYLVERGQGSFKMGLLSSFETLRDTKTNIQNEPKKGDSQNEDNDFFDAHYEPQDAEFVQRLNDSFKAEFDLELEHPKLEKMAQELTDIAFSEGEKVLVFCRRINTVKALASRIEQLYLAKTITAIETRWELKIDLDNGMLPTKELGESDMVKDHPGMPDPYDGGTGVLSKKLNKATLDGGWLKNFQRKLGRTGSLNLFFEENWVRVIARLAGKTLQEIKNILSETKEGKLIVAETNQVKSSKGREIALRYIAYQIIERLSDKLCLPELKKEWLVEGFSNIFGEDCFKQIHISGQLNKRIPDFIDHKGFWNYWDEHTKGGEDSNFSHLHLGEFECLDQFYLRFFRMRIISTVLRFSPDTILELYCCYTKLFEKTEKNILEETAEQFVARTLFPLEEENSRAILLQENLSGWLSDNTILLIENCFENETLSVLAKQGNLLRRKPVVVGVTADTKDETALNQFNMPCFPLILIGTDVIKEGLNLHLNCRRVVHYGAAWTPGDMEQRIGRVDRINGFFERASISGSLLNCKRRIGGVSASLESSSITDNLVKIKSSMPYLRKTLEQHQRIQIDRNYKNIQKLLGIVSHEISIKDKTIDIDAAYRPQAPVAVDATDEHSNHSFDFDFDSVEKNGSEIQKILRCLSQNGESEKRMPDQIDNLIKLLGGCGMNVRRNMRAEEEKIADVNYKEKYYQVSCQPFLSFLKCRTIVVSEKIMKQTADSSNGKSESTPLIRTEVEYDEQVLKRDRRFFVGSNFEYANASIKNYIAQSVCEIENTKGRDEIIRILQKEIPGAGPGISFTIKKEKSNGKDNKFSASLTGLGRLGREQTTLGYVYVDHLLLASNVCWVNMLKHDERFSSEGIFDEIKLQRWILETNNTLSFGYLYYRKDKKTLQLCERVNYLDLPSKTLANIVYYLCLDADLMELTLTAKDSF